VPDTELGSLSATPRTRHQRLCEQGRTDRAELLAVLRAGLIAHLGVPTDQGVMVIPTGYGFDEHYAYAWLGGQPQPRSGRG
jgi:uncharacterized protein